jgi:hypothetical protein
MSDLSNDEFSEMSVTGSATGTCGGVVGGQRLGGWALRGPLLLLHGGQRELILPREGAEVVIEVVGSQARAHFTTGHRRQFEEKIFCKPNFDNFDFQYYQCSVL